MDVVIVRENEEDLYAGIEHRQTDEVFQCLKLISRAGLARRSCATPSSTRARNNRKKVTCFTKDNIMKMTDGLFHKVFDEIGAGVPGHREGALDRRHRRGQARRHARGLRRDRDAEPLRRHPLGRRGADRRFGRPRRLAPTSASTCAMFEAIHGSAPRRAGPEPRQSVGAAARRRDDARPHRPARRRRARAQRLAANHRGRHPHLRHLQRRGVEPREGRHEGVRRGGDGATRAGACRAQAGAAT